MPEIMELLADVGVAGGYSELNRAPYHIGLATNDIDTMRATLSTMLGCSWTDIEDQKDISLFDGHGQVVQSARTSHSKLGPFSMELLEGSPGSLWETDRALQVHHLAYWSTDVPGDIRDLLGRGWSIDLTFLDADGEYDRFAYLSKPGALRVEFVDVRWRYEHHAAKLGAAPQLAV